MALKIRDPGRGTFDTDAAEPPRPWKAALPELLANRLYVWVVLGYTAVTFSTGVMADWYAEFLHRDRGMDLVSATSTMGAVVVVAGLAGTALGGWLGEKFVGRTRHPYLAMSGLTMAVAAVFAIPAVVVTDTRTAIVCAGISQLFLWAYNGPVNALLVNCVPSALRVRAFALSILTIHAFGDAISPSVAGIVSDLAHSLPTAMLLVPSSVAIGAAIWIVAWRRLPEAA
jgi:sugar phosphate permease